MRIKDLKDAHYNPRRISKDALSGLKASLKNFGDISGVVFNRRTGNLVAGHQRVRALREEHGDDLEIFQEGYEGHIKLPDGSHVRVRFVDWDEATEKAANVTANNPYVQGEWTIELDDLVSDIQLELPELAAEIRIDQLGPPTANAPVTTGEGTVVDDLAGEWEGMPEFVQDANSPFREVMVRFQNEEGVRLFEEAIGQKLPDNPHRKNIWFPKKEIERFVEYVNDGEDLQEDGEP